MLRPPTPKGYRLLEYGEITKEGDIYARKTFPEKWRTGAFGDVRVRPENLSVYARKITSEQSIDLSYLWE